MSVDLNETLDVLLNGKSSTISKDLKLNLERILTNGALDKREGGLALLACASAVDFAQLAQFARTQLKHQDIPEAQINEAAESAAIMAMLNIYYRARHFLTEGNAENVEAHYKATGLRMISLSKPLLGKDTFEMLAFAVSVVNGCQSCVNSHEQVLRESGIDPQKIHDLIRLAAVVKGLKTLTMT